MSQDSPPGCRLGPYSYLSTVLQRFVSGEGIIILIPHYDQNIMALTQPYRDLRPRLNARPGPRDAAARTQGLREAPQSSHHR
jgi:hypothetical protein